jgi:ankyrin repeat protein
MMFLYILLIHKEGRLMKKVVLLLCITLQLYGADEALCIGRVSAKQLRNLVKEGSVEVVQKVFRAQPELKKIVNVQDKRGRTLLMDVFIRNRFCDEVAEFLINVGADPLIKDNKGMDSYAMSFITGHCDNYYGLFSPLKKFFDAYYQEQNKCSFEDKDVVTQCAWMKERHGVPDKVLSYVMQKGLLDAVKSLDVKTVENLLSKGVDQCTRTLHGEANPLHEICLCSLDTQEEKEKAKAIVFALMQAPHADKCLRKKMLCSRGDDFIDNLKPLDILLYNGGEQKLKMFADAGFDFDESHIRRVVKKRYVRGLKALLNIKPDLIKSINTQGKDGKTLLTSLVSTHEFRPGYLTYEMVQLLLDFGADPLQRNAMGQDAYAVDFKYGGGKMRFLRDAFHEYMERQGRPLIVEHDKKYRKNINVCEWLALHHGAQFKVVDGFRFLEQERCKHMFDMLKQCSDLNEDRELNTQLLAKALSYVDWERREDYEPQRSDVVALLIDYGADPSSGKLLHGFRPFNSRVFPFVIMLNLLSSRPEFAEKNIFEELQSITWASFGKNHLELLANEVCNCYLEDFEQELYLNYLEQLLETNIDLRAKASKYLLKYFKSESLITLWCRYGADINAQDNNGNTVFMKLACKGKFGEVMESCARDLKADLSIKNICGYTVFSLRDYHDKSLGDHHASGCERGIQ